MEMAKTLDVICIGRSSVDLYGEQVGGRLEDMASFAKYVGGCPTNISIGTARLGLKPGLITAVGDEHGPLHQGAGERRGGRHPRRQDRSGASPRWSSSAFATSTFPLIFYRDNCADSALTEDDVDEAYIASAGAVVVSGTHFSRPNLDAMSKKAMRLAKHGGRVIFDIDYRPVLWGLTGHGLGEERFVANQGVSAHLQTILPGCDVIVGTEEEIHIAGGTTDTLGACRKIRELAPEALIVVKRGDGLRGVRSGDSGRHRTGHQGPGFPIEVFNILGAGDAFMSGFLRGYLRDEPIETAASTRTRGAFAVSRHGCAPAVRAGPSCSTFLHGSTTRPCARTRSSSRSTGRPRARASGRRSRNGVRPPRPARADGGRRRHHARAHPALQEAVPQRGAPAAAGRPDFGILLDERSAAMRSTTPPGTASGSAARSSCRSIPLRFEGGADVGSTVRAWPSTHCVKCRVFYHPDDPAALRRSRRQRCSASFDAARQTSHELCSRSSRAAPRRRSTTPSRERWRGYGHGVFPDWWKLPDPGSQAAWDAIAATLAP